MVLGVPILKHFRVVISFCAVEKKHKAQNGRVTAPPMYSFALKVSSVTFIYLFCVLNIK